MSRRRSALGFEGMPDIFGGVIAPVDVGLNDWNAVIMPRCGLSGLEQERTSGPGASRFKADITQL